MRRYRGSCHRASLSLHILDGQAAHAVATQAVNAAPRLVPIVDDAVAAIRG